MLKLKTLLLFGLIVYQGFLQAHENHVDQKPIANVAQESSDVGRLWVSDDKVKQFMMFYKGNATEEEIRQVLLIQTVFAAAAKREGIRQVAFNDRIKQTALLAKQYEQWLFQQFSPNENELREYYEKSFLPLAKGLKNVDIVPFEVAKSTLRQSLIMERIDTHFLSLLKDRELIAFR